MAGHMETSDEPQRRLIITDMVLKNFKSYAGEQRVGPFHKVTIVSWLTIVSVVIIFNRHLRVIAASISGLTCPSERNLRREALTLPRCLQSFSSVVGPNGSGKSNVIDAMLFVFGKKAKQVTQIMSEKPCISPSSC